MLPFLPPDVSVEPPAEPADIEVFGAAQDAARDAGMAVNYELMAPEFWWVPFQVRGQTFYAVQHPKHGLWIRGALQGLEDATFDWFPRTRRLRPRALPSRVATLLARTVAQYGRDGHYYGLTASPPVTEPPATKKVRVPRAKSPSITEALRESARLADEAEALSAQEVPRLAAPPDQVPAGKHVIVWRGGKHADGPATFVVVPTLYRKGSWVVHDQLDAAPGNRLRPELETHFTVSELRTGMAIHHAPTLAEASKLARALHAVSSDPFPGARMGQQDPSAPPALMQLLYDALEPFFQKDRARVRAVLAGKRGPGKRRN